MVEVYHGFEVAATLFETSVFLDFLTKLLGKKYSDRNQSAIAIIAFLTINTFIISMNLIVPQYSALQDVGVLILYMVYALFFTSGSLIMKIITPALTITSICTINLITVFSLAPLWQLRFSELITERNVQRIIVLFLTKAVFFLLTRLTLRNVKPKEIILSIKEYFAVAVSFICSVIIILYFTENQYRSNQITLDYSVVIVLFSVVLINIASSVLFAVLVKRNRERTQHMMVEIQFQEQQKMYQSVCSAYRNLEILQHDMKNDLLSLQSLIHQGKLSEAERFVEQYTNTNLDHFRTYVRTGYELIDAVVNIKLNYAREMQIDVHCQITADFSYFEPEDILSIFSNAIDNAIESSMQQVKRYISVTMENKRDYLHITISNAIHTSVLESNANLLTTKQEKEYHGFGTQSMQRIVKKYDGMIDFYEDKGLFYVDILLKHAKRESQPTNKKNLFA